MIRKSKKKGFTIVELVIVIAVIGVLAAVLIPTFISLNKKAEKAADDSLIQNLNTALRIEEGTEGKNKTCHDAILDVEEYGYKLANLVSKSGKTIVWDQESDEFILDAGEDKNTVRYWEIRSDMPGAENNRSIYAGNNWSVKNVGGEEGITVGFDAGSNTTEIETVYYKNLSESTNTVIIRTNSVLQDVSINAPKATVNHYGEVGKVDITKIDMNCYNEYGSAKYVKVTEGKVVAKANGTINIAFADNTDGNKVAVIEETAGTIDNGYTRVEEVDTTNQSREDGIPLTYAIYVDETTVISGDAFVDYVESTAEYAVETAKQVEEAAQKEKEQTGPTGSFSDPFTVEEAAFGDLIIEVGESYDGSYSMTGDDPWIVNDHFEEVWDAIDYLLGDVEISWYFDGDPELTESEIVEVSIDDWTGACIDATSVGSVDVTFVNVDEDEEIGTVLICVTGEMPEEDDGSEVYSLNDVVKDVNPSNPYVDLTNVTNGSTIKLLRDYSGRVEFFAKNNKSITVDLNGHFIKDLTLKDITVTVVDSSSEKSGKAESLTFTCWYGLQNPNFVFNPWTDDVARNDYHEGEGYEYLETWFDKPATLTLLGGSIKTLALHDCGEVVIAGATIINTDPVTYTTGSAIHLGVNYQFVSIEVRSGILVGQKDFSYAGSVKISGGFFSEEVPSQYLVAGYTCNKIAEGMYQVVAK